MNNEERIIEKLEEHDKRFNEHDKRFDEHDKRFDVIAQKLDEHDKRFESLEYKLDTLGEKVLTSQDEILSMVRRVDQERVFTTAWVKRIEDDIRKIKTELKIN